MESRDGSLLRPYLSLLIIIAESEAPSKEELSEMVAEINRTQVEAEEVLSDHAYYYDRKQEKLVL